MRIKIGDNEYQVELNAVGHTIVAGQKIAANGILKPFVEDITVYKEIDGEIVEVLPEEIPELPTMDNLVFEIKAFMVEYGIDFSSADYKQDLIDKIHIFYGLPVGG